MNDNLKSLPVTVFEGPDGGGKTTLARQYAEVSGARYVHHGPYKGVAGYGLGRLYAESILPAVLGYQPVVLDRSWLSEPIYAAVYRAGVTRLDAGDRAVLDRLLLRCAPLTVLCLPPVEVVTTNFLFRKGEEYLDSVAQLVDVYARYQLVRPVAPTLRIDYTINDDVIDELLRNASERPLGHPVAWASAGAWLAPIMIVGDCFGEIKTNDSLYQWPFASFTDVGCSRWLAKLLQHAEIKEEWLFWINTDQITTGRGREFRELAANRHVIALGDVADARLTELGIDHYKVPHPQFYKRFKGSEPYPLPELIREIMRNV